MKVVVTSATEGECAGIKTQVDTLYTGNTDFEVAFHKSGVGMLASVFSLSKLANELKPDFIIQAGIAGSFSTLIPLDMVVAVKDEQPGDIGVEEKGIFSDIFDMKLQDANEFPFNNKKLVNPWLQNCNYLKLPEVSGVTVNEITTRTNRISHLHHQYTAGIESMEGAALHYVCLQTGIPFIQLRAISNYVGERDKTKWHMKPALQNLTTTVLEYINSLSDKNKTSVTHN